MPITKASIRQNLYFTGLILIALGMPLSTFLMSLGQFCIAAAWLMEGQYRSKIESFLRNPICLGLLAYFLLHVIGMAFTTDTQIGLRELRIKVPLFVVPFLLATSPPLSPQKFRALINTFIFACFCGTFVSMGVYFHLIPTKHIIRDTRDISIYVSHIRFSLMLVLAVFLIPINNWHSTSLPKLNLQLPTRRFLQLLLMIWFVIFLFILHALTGVIILLLISIGLGLYQIIKSRNVLLKWASFSALLLLLIGGFFYLRTLYLEVYQPLIPYSPQLVHSHLPTPSNSLAPNTSSNSSNSPSSPNSANSPNSSINPNFNSTSISNKELTPSGNPYHQDTVNAFANSENGHPVGAYTCWPEMKLVWNRRSAVPFDSINKTGDTTKFTLLRYLASMGLRKDSAGVTQLSAIDIKAIENGITNFHYLHYSGLIVRILQTFWELKQYQYAGGVDGHSLTMRFEFWKAAIGVIKQHFWFGVGTGDFHQAMQEQYTLNHSPLSMANRLDSHNQYLSVMVSFGLIGLLIFLVSLLMPFFVPSARPQLSPGSSQTSNKSMAYIIFFAILCCSFFNEDTLTTQAGVTFYVFFNSVLLFARL